FGTQQLRVDHLGELIEKKWIGNSPAGDMMGDLGGTFLNLPEKPLHVGDTWNGRYDFGEKTVGVTYKLDGVSGAPGHEVANVSATVDDDSLIKLKEPIAFKLDLSTGLPIAQKMV